MISQKIQDIIRSDFEKWLRFNIDAATPIGLNSFVSFGISLLNFYVGSKVLDVDQKTPAARYLCELFNGGLKSKIEMGDLHHISMLIADAEELDYQQIAAVY